MRFQSATTTKRTSSHPSAPPPPPQIFPLLLVLALAPVGTLCSATHQQTLLVLSELCHHRFSLDDGLNLFANFSLKMVPTKEFCDEDSLWVLQHVAAGHPVLGTLRPELCAPVQYFSLYHNVTMAIWNCPQDSEEEEIGTAANVNIGSSSRRNINNLGPSSPFIARGFATLVSYMRWRSIGIIATSSGWWPRLSQLVAIQLRELGIVARFYEIVPHDSSDGRIERKLELLRRTPCRVIVVFASGDASGQALVAALDRMRTAEDDDYNSLLVLMDISALPSWTTPLLESGRNSTTIREDIIKTISSETKKYTLIFTEAEVLHQSLEHRIVGRIAKHFIKSNESWTEGFALVDLKEDDTLRRLVSVDYKNDSLFEAVPQVENFEEWLAKHVQTEDCDGCESNLAHMLSFVIIFVCSCLSLFIIFVIAAIARYQLLKKKVTKGPYKVLLTATDFVFPQIADSRRVDEGIEAMLCCWLQQLQEFGGPEVDKPDLLQGSSGGNARTPLRGGSSPSLAKQIIVDPRVRYNGDLVQMKPIQTGGNVELRAKTVELLLVLHGLRHENLNPLIGCLAEPPRACLVSEWCARGSLQDVLQQDDIKLDWSFRLSLLTDLVRGMKYLHASPIRIHGFLTSRNCVIDARWVLKVTDYGMPAFYEAQGISPDPKTAKELLWTAPELLRHSSLRKKGTQPGDVYSFGIIMQEVVVRGEPFCMLALTPEEIIEKVKKPPPLIRPSVSKGAAPPEAINIMRQCWAEQADMRPDFNAVHDQFKKLNHGRKVNIVDTMFQMLEKYSNNLEELIRERTEQLDIEKKKTEQLLNRMLPSSVAEKLKLGMPVDPEAFAEVTIYFSDIVGFTTISAHSTPFQVVDLLNDLYTCFDATINAYNVYKVETIGDAYMVVGGLPVRVLDHAEQVATMALDLLHQSGRFRIRHLPGTPLRLRIGLHTGPCCAGVVGLTMPRYCLFGDTVNTASRMESTGSAWRIHLSEATKGRLERAGGYQLEYRGPIDVKGKGTMHTYWLLGKAGFDKPLPAPPSLEESHGLDESLIICKSNSANEVCHGCDASPSESRVLQQHEDRSQDPTFMKSMECSKFASLIRSQDLDHPLHHIVKSTSSDTPGISLGTPVSASEVAAALLGASTSSLSGFRVTRPRRIEEEDLSTPYNHYKCLSPKDKVSKLLRRQFSLDRTEEVTQEIVHKALSPRLCKQNSAGAVDLEKIEEAPTTMRSSPTTPAPATLHCSLSISVDSLIH
ncbi:PREDICTED: retinal guanylyl cyclase 2-like isoform X2 [Nicrophorus vespilloides]|uniref:Guanylate cyclase n=1 Tax=Nicrophorus vespilloides TaxID=110193 RepID=A0ABM1NF31_NICVS|nr:PREDICTED: retinal guanylyl cyclase 2-like isoform X2 [Nicrophorus vespilloides]